MDFSMGYHAIRDRANILYCKKNVIIKIQETVFAEIVLQNFLTTIVVLVLSMIEMFLIIVDSFGNKG